MSDRVTDSTPHINAEQLAAAARCSAEACAVTGVRAPARSSDNTTTLDFNQSNIYGDAATAAAPGNSEKAALTAHIEPKLAANPERLTHFRAEMIRFADRAAEIHLPQSEISATYRNIDRLLQAGSGGPLSSERRLILAEQVMEHAANPYGINQGNHNSCALNALEVRVFARNPAAAAALIADVALTGSYRSKDGRTYHINPAPHDTSAAEFIYDGTRSHASEIFQVTASNIFAEQANNVMHSLLPGSPNVRFEQRPTSGQNVTGETLVAYYPHGRAEVLRNRTPFVSTTGNDGWLLNTLTEITGKTEPDTFIARDISEGGANANVINAKSAAELQNILAQAKAEGKFPITVFVHTGNDPFWSDSDDSGSGGGHVVNITDYVAAGPDGKSYASVDNSWSYDTDHDRDKSIDLNTLYNSMAHPALSVPYLQDLAARARASGSPDYGTEFEVLRIQSLYGLSTPREVINNLTITVDENLITWMNNLSPRQQSVFNRELHLINSYIRPVGNN